MEPDEIKALSAELPVRIRGIFVSINNKSYLVVSNSISEKEVADVKACSIKLQQASAKIEFIA